MMLCEGLSGKCKWVCFSFLAVLSMSVTSAAQGPDAVERGNTVFASANREPAGVGHLSCIELKPVPGAEFSSQRPTLIVLKDVHSLSKATGPFAVYVEAAGTTQHIEAHRVGYFSLYSIQQRTDGQDLSFDVKPELLDRFLSARGPSGGLQVCVENRSPGSADDRGTVAKVARAILVQLPNK